MASRSASAAKALATALTSKAYAAELGRFGRSVREERERQGLTLDVAVAQLADMPQADLDWFRSKKSGPVRPDYWQGQLSRLERGTNSASLARTLLLLDLLGLRLELHWAEGPKPPRGPKQAQPVKTSRAAASARARAEELYGDLIDQVTVLMSEEFPGVTLRQVADEFSSPKVGINLNNVLTKTVQSLLDVTTAKHGILIKVAAVLGHRVVVVHAGDPATRHAQTEEPVSSVGDLTLDDFAEPTTAEQARRVSDRLASIAYTEAAAALAGRTLQGRRDFMSATLVFDDQARFVNGELTNAPPGKVEQHTVISGARLDTNYGTVWLRQVFAADDLHRESAINNLVVVDREANVPGQIKEHVEIDFAARDAATIYGGEVGFAQPTSPAVACHALDNCQGHLCAAAQLLIGRALLFLELIDDHHGHHQPDRRLPALKNLREVDLVQLLRVLVKERGIGDHHTTDPVPAFELSACRTEAVLEHGQPVIDFDLNELAHHAYRAGRHGLKRPVAPSQNQVLNIFFAELVAQHAHGIRCPSQVLGKQVLGRRAPTAHVLKMSLHLDELLEHRRAVGSESGCDKHEPIVPSSADSRAPVLVESEHRLS